MVSIKQVSFGVEKGKQFGKWRVIGVPFSRGGYKGKKHRYGVVAQCECGGIAVVWCHQIARGQSDQCEHCRNRTHGGKGTRLYQEWSGMKVRCYGPERERGHYRRKGIQVCSEWRNDFAAFEQWALANGYRDDLQIDRKNNAGNYEPGNCRWTNRFVQARNKDNNRLVTAFGETKCLAEWAEDERCSVHRNTIRMRLSQYGWAPERAILEPSKRNRMKTA